MDEKQLATLLKEREELLQKYPQLQSLQSEIDQLLSQEKDPMMRTLLMQKKMMEALNVNYSHAHEDLVKAYQDMPKIN